MQHLRVAVVGGGTGGLAAGLLLARDGHAVDVFERVADPLPVGAGILLQPLGQRVLAEVGLADDLAACSTPVHRVEGRTTAGRPVLLFAYSDSPRGQVGLGVHRGDLFNLLWHSLRESGVAVRTATEIASVNETAAGWLVVGSDGDAAGPFDLVVAADGSRSRIRRQLGLARKDVGYPYGVIWSVVPDPDGSLDGTLGQVYRDTRTTLGLLPTGAGMATVYWAIPNRNIAATVAAGPAAFVDRVLPIAGPYRELVERVATAGILPSRYRDVVVRTPVVTRPRSGIVLIGDAAHAMSPQLGLGASLALADAWSLATALRIHRGDVRAALRAHASARGDHVRWYTWLSRLLTPAFQSDLVPMGWARDLVFGPAQRVPWVRRQFVEIMLGEQTSPWTSWHPPG